MLKLVKLYAKPVPKELNHVKSMVYGLSSLTKSDWCKTFRLLAADLSGR
jgi:hypothetical protein